MINNIFKMLIVGTMMLIIGPCITRAQSVGDNKEKSPVSFGKINVTDFESSVYSIDSAASAVILADIGSSRIEGNNKGWFSVIHTHYRRVHVLNKAAYDLADVAINLYVDGNDQEKLIKVKANTYNLEGGKIVTSSLSSKDVFTDKSDKNHVTRKFTFSNVKEGSIIEYEYTTSSDFLFNFQPWAFQGKIPRLWSEYNVEIPEFLEYVFLSYGYHPFYIRAEKSQERQFSVHESGTASGSERYQFKSNVKSIRFVMKDVFALKEEPFISTLANHISRIDFQLSGYREPLAIKRILGDWTTSCEKLLSFDDFGADLGKDNKWLDEEMTKVQVKDTSLLARVRQTFYYVRDQYKCNGTQGIYLSKAGLKNVVKAKGGNVADINLLLTAMLRYMQVEAHPVILSTTEHGIAHPFYPLLSQYNYVIVKAMVNGKAMLLDASNTSLPFGKLMPYCYNGIARAIYGESEPIYLNTDSLREASQVYITLAANEKGEMMGRITKHLGEHEDINTQAKLKADGIEGIRKEMEKSMGTEMVLDSLQVISGQDDDPKSLLKYTYVLNGNDEQLLFINPLQTEQTKKNPFVSAIRNYPIEMPYRFDETLIFNLNVPSGYTLDEVPKSMVISLDEERSCIYQYKIHVEGNKVELLSRFTINRANFAADEYPTLRSFFDLVVKKQNETIVLKKI